MQTIYGYDSQGYSTDETREIQDHDPVYPGWTRTAPPDVVEGERAIWQVGLWTVLDYVPAVHVYTAPIPTSCQRRQGRLALLELGLLDQVEGFLAAIEDEGERRIAQIEYEADTWELDNEFLRTMWKLLSGSDDGLSDVFVLAATK